MTESGSKYRLTTLPNQGQCVAVPMGLDDRGLPIDGLVVRTPAGELRAYINVCKHIPIPLDSGSGEFLTADGSHLFCGTHGATFRLEDGMCVHGPCKGVPLDAVFIEEDEGGAWLRRAEPT